WDSASGVKAEDSLGNPDLSHCYLYEMTRYESKDGALTGGFFVPCNPPFENWKFREPTDGRTGPVGYERFVATQGWAWDRHKLGGRLIVPKRAGDFIILGTQEYRFTCERCGVDLQVPGSDAGPHRLLRRFAPRAEDWSEGEDATEACVWRYVLSKHGID